MKYWIFITAFTAFAFSTQAESYFTDTFERANNLDIDAETNGMSGLAAPVTYYEYETSEGLAHISDGKLQLADGNNASVVGLENHNFTNAAILAESGFSVSVDILDMGKKSDPDHFCGFGIGLSSNEIAALAYDNQSSNGPRGTFSGGNNGVADFYVSWTPNNGGGVQLFSADTSGGTQIDVPSASGGLLQADFFFDSFSAASNVDAVVYFDGTPISTNQFAWNGNAENYLALSCRQAANGMTIDNLTVASPIGNRPTDTPPPPPSEPSDDSYQVLRNSSASPLDILRNDTGTGLSIISISTPSNGVAVADGDQINYTPTTDFSGLDYFDYTTVDAGSATNTATVTVDVREYPNFVFILTDDQSWVSLSSLSDTNRPYSKSDYHLTPRFEQLATDGIRFSRGYSPAPNCSPSRYANLTGKTCVRLGYTDIEGRNVNPAGPDNKWLLISPGKVVDAVQPEEVTIPELLKTISDAGYRAAHWGKWHLAPSDNPTDPNGDNPNQHGFDVSDGATGNKDGNKNVEGDPKLVYSITARANSFMETESLAGNPFYCQVSHYAVHAGVEYLQSSYDLYNGIPKGTVHDNQKYAAMMTDMDISIGQLLDQIDDLGIRNSTYIIYQADNGATISSNLPLRGNKPEVWEGGMRVPTFVRGPGIKANTQCDLPVMGIDILPTIWEWATGSTTGLPANIDGGSWVQTINDISAGNPPSEIVRDGEMVGYTPHYVISNTKDQRPRAVMHDGDYKLVVQYELGTIELYNLTERIEEDDDIAGTAIGKKWEMWVRLRDYMKQVGALIALPDPDNYGPADGIDDGDVDNDGLLDEWEARELLTYAFDGTADNDQDGISNADELAQGTDPLLPNATTIANISIDPTAKEAQFDWQGTPGRRYAVEFTETLGDEWETLTIVESNDGFGLQATVSTSGTRGFYRVRQL